MSNYELPSRSPVPRPQPASQDSTDVIALVIEIVFGFFGLLGMGWLYVGNFVNAIVIFIGYFPHSLLCDDSIICGRGLKTTT